MISEQALQIVAENAQVNIQNCNRAIELLLDGATIPFVSRYRKEATGNLNEVQIETIWDNFEKLSEVEKRKAFIIETIRQQDKITPELEDQILKTWDIKTLEDIYLPFKPHKKTKADIAKELGLEPLAATIMAQQHTNIHLLVEQFTKPPLKSTNETIEGAIEIMAQWINERAQVRNALRYLFKHEAEISSKLVKNKAEEGEKYQDYFKFSEPIKRIKGHRVLALFRGENEKILKVKIHPDKERAIALVEQKIIKPGSSTKPLVQKAINYSYKKLLQPQLETEFKNEIKLNADKDAIAVFAENLRQLLLAPPLGTKRILAIDPGFKTGCKVVCLDNSGNLLHNETIYPHPPQNQTSKAAAKIKQLVEVYKIDAIAIGNGTAGRETEDFVKYKMKFNSDVDAYVVNEAGASIYSASKIARAEFPQYDVTVRGAVSIGRRLMDPLAELVKIDPKSIGVGQYQHDVDQVLLKNALNRVVESCVNKVGVHLNTASEFLLQYVSGIGPKLAQNIVDYRKEKGLFTNRNELKKVPGLGEKAFEQASGFLRVPGSKNILDNTGIHPESYKVAEEILQSVGIALSELLKQKEKLQNINLQQFVAENIGLPTLEDIVKELQKPGRDPRGKTKQFQFDKNIRKIEDLYVGMVLNGLVSNITKFGAFVNLGVKQDGLVHISQMAQRFISDPNEVVKLGDQVTVKVLEIDAARKRIQLSMILNGE